ncbi:MAG: TIGR00730 family Rossman fold protein [Phycisphaeraceae bacterium]|nr:TIGR00730 family Rossman fold protein [Phycisphaeraceae bacterium]
MNICVYCGSSRAVEERYLAVADEMGAAMAAAGHNLVFGGGSIGLMGRLASAVADGGGRVIGVMPEGLKESEFPFDRADEMVFTRQLRERKAIMAERADAYAVLPGGIGTLEEMFETMTLRLLGSHDRSIVIVNAHGFYDTLLSFIDELFDRGFARERAREHFKVARDVPAAIEMFAESAAEG